MQLDLIFTGLMAFVIGDAPDANGRCNPMTSGDLHVLMLSGMDSEPHRPRLVADVSHVRWTDGAHKTSDADEILPILDAFGSEQRQIAVWSLENQRLVVEGMPATGLQLGDGTRDTEPDATKKNKWKDEKVDGSTASSKHFSWIADLQEACPEGNRVKKECVEDPPTCGAVSARAQFAYTTQKSDAVLLPQWHHDPDNNVYEFPDATQYSQALADGARIKAEIADTVIRLRLEPFDKTKPTRTVLLAAPSAAPAAQAWVSDGPVRTPSPSVKVTHFQSYYGLLAKENDCRNPKLKTGTSQVVKCAICASCDGQ